MNIEPCLNGLQHTWLPTTGTVLQCYSCPACKQRIYWSDTLVKWVRHDGRPVQPSEPTEERK